MRLAMLCLVTVAACGDNAQQPRDASIDVAVSDGMVDVMADALGSNGVACAVDGDCGNGHCVPNVPSGTGGTCCATACTPTDACHVAQCSTGTCQDVAISSGQCVVTQSGDQLTTCGVTALGCGTIADTDGDNFPDAWETTSNGVGSPYADVNCNGSWDLAEPLLTGASPTVPDIYLTYDFMGPGLGENACATSATCTGLSSFHAGERCNTDGQCQFDCSQDSDCTGRSGPAHAGETCRLFAGGGACTDSPGSPTGACACYHTHDPEAIAPGALQKVIDVFALHGVALHIIRGKPQPHSHVVSYRSDAQMSIGCEGADVAAGTVGVGRYAVSFSKLKSLPLNADTVMHYALFAHHSGCDSIAHCPADQGSSSTCTTTTLRFGQSGMAELGGNDFIVSLGNSGLAPGITSAAGFSRVGATLMHELGHNLGIRHDGHVDRSCPLGTECASDEVCADFSDGQGSTCHQITGEEPNYKPNYISLMNYMYQPGGIQSSSVQNVAALGMPYTPGSNVPDPALTRLDFSNQVLNTLTENNLDDTPGLGWTVDPLYPGAYLLFHYTDGTCHLCPQTAPAAGSVDWTCVDCAMNPSCQLLGSGPSVFDGSGLAADVASEPGTCSLTPSDTLHGHKDWGNFVYAFQCRPSFANGIAPPTSYPPE